MHRLYDQCVRAGIFVLMLTALAACQPSARPHGVDLPAGGEPQIGVGYVVSVYCGKTLQLGSTWWAFETAPDWPPPMSDGTPDWWPWKSVGMPYEVPATVTLVSADEAIFRAASDGSELHLTRRSEAPAHEEACL